MYYRAGRPNASLAEVTDAAKEANAHEFILKLPDVCCISIIEYILTHAYLIGYWT